MITGYKINIENTTMFVYASNKQSENKIKKVTL